MKRNTKMLITGIAAFLFAAAAGCSGDSSNPYGTGSTPGTIPPNTIAMNAMSFSPSTLTIARGTTITWRNDDGSVHTSTSDSTGWDTGNVPSGSSRTTTFNTPGIFRFHCIYHSAMGMVGTITVQ